MKNNIMGEGRSMVKEFNGTSLSGDFNEAIQIAIKSAKESLRSDYVRWNLVRVRGDNGGFTLEDNLTVTITADAEPGDARAYFQVLDSSDDKTPFIIELTGANIRHARRILAGEDVTGVHVQGTIVKSAAHYNPGWSFHVDSSTIEFFDTAVEVCDATMTYVEEHLEEVGGSTLPDCHWCPWTSRIIAEVPVEETSGKAG